MNPWLYIISKEKKKKDMKKENHQKDKTKGHITGRLFLYKYPSSIIHHNQRRKRQKLQSSM